MKTNAVLDNIDKQLLRALQKDGRASYADMSEIVGLTPPAVRARVQRLRDHGILQIAAITDPIALGYRESAIVCLKVDGDPRVIADALGEIQNVVYMVMTVGGYDIILEVVSASRDEFAKVLNEQIRPIEGIRTMDAFPYTSIHTHRFNWGVPE
jgi:Lrp/AsnC family transcriptional regulator, regulator for asnA, asnC and gidA